MPKNIVGEPFSASVIAGTEKVWIRGAGGSIKIFCGKFFVSQSRKTSYGEPYSVSLIAGTEKVWIRERGSIKIFRRKFFVSQCRKFS